MAPRQITSTPRQIEQDYGRRRTVGQAGGTSPAPTWNYPLGSADERRYPVSGTKSKTGINASRLGPRPMPSLLDDMTEEEVAYLRGLAENELAAYEQKRQANEVDAERRRIPVRRNINIQQEYAPLAQRGVSAETDELLAALNQVIPQTQQAYAQGSQDISAAYNAGATNLAGQVAGQSSLARQLEQMSGQSGAPLEQQMEGTTEFIQNLLNSSGGAGSASLAGIGAAELDAIRNSLGGYNTENEQVNRDIALQSAAEIQGLSQDLALITPDFLPFNYGDLMLRTNQGIRDAIRAGTERQRTERERLAEAKEASRTRYTGYEGAQQLAGVRGRPELFNELLSMISGSEQEGTGRGGVQTSIEAFGDDPHGQVQALIESGAEEDEIKALVEDLGLDYEADYKPRGGGVRLSPINVGLGVAMPGFTSTRRRRPVRINRVNQEDTARRAQDQAILRELMYAIYGEHASYAD